MTAPLTPANVQAEPTPGSRLCRALGGCLGDAWCVYCGAEMPAEQVAVNLLQALTGQLRRAVRG